MCAEVATGVAVDDGAAAAVAAAVEDVAAAVVERIVYYMGHTRTHCRQRTGPGNHNVIRGTGQKRQSHVCVCVCVFL